VGDSTLVKYYYAGSQRIAMREGSDAPYFFVGDHLGSTSLTLDEDGDVYSEMRYKPFGETAWSSTTDTPTQRRYTGQLQDFDMVNMQLYFYNARYYDPELARFTQADTIVPQPGNPQDWNRYSYTRNNPILYTDPTGHWSEKQISNYLQSTYGEYADLYLRAWKSDAVFWEALLAAEHGDTLTLPLGGQSGVF
jgi:RHS repeat-associated protein